MIRFLFTLCATLCLASMAEAQTFTQHLRQKQQGASVAITQSHEIEELVNKANVSARKQDNTPAKSNTATTKANNTATTKASNNTPTKKQNTQEQVQQKHTAQQHNGDSAHAQSHEQAQRHTSQTPQANATHQPSTDGDDMDIPTIDMRKKVMRRSYKVNGYRVQVFAGGNSRADKEKAQKAGTDMKMAFPSQPVYVHFYSPRWICRIGNYRTYNEANAILTQVKKMGYKQACIVSGKITVAY